MSAIPVFQLRTFRIKSPKVLPCGALASHVSISQNETPSNSLPFSCEAPQPAFEPLIQIKLDAPLPGSYRYDTFT